MKPRDWIIIGITVVSLCGSGAWALYGALTAHVQDVARIGAKVDAVAADVSIIKTAIIGKGLARNLP